MLSKHNGIVTQHWQVRGRKGGARGREGGQTNLKARLKETSHLNVKSALHTASARDLASRWQRLHHLDLPHHRPSRNRSLMRRPQEQGRPLIWIRYLANSM